MVFHPSIVTQTKRADAPATESHPSLSSGGAELLLRVWGGVKRLSRKLRKAVALVSPCPVGTVSWGYYSIHEALETSNSIHPADKEHQRQSWKHL